MISRAPRALLYIHPTGGPDAADPCVDTLTAFLLHQLLAARTVNIACQGAAVVYTPRNETRHQSTCRCDGQLWSSVDDYLLPCGLITNSLSLHYVAFHRTEIPVREWHKLLRAWADERPRPVDLEGCHNTTLTALVSGDAASLKRNVWGSQHLGVSCSACKEVGFRGPRYVCLDCDANYCASCYVTVPHDPNHAIARLLQPSARFDKPPRTSIKRQRTLAWDGTLRRLGPNPAPRAPNAAPPAPEE